MSMKKRIAFAIGENLHHQMQESAKILEISESEFVRHAVMEYCEKVLQK